MPHRWSVELLETVVFKPAGFIGFQTVTDRARLTGLSLAGPTFPEPFQELGIDQLELGHFDWFFVKNTVLHEIPLTRLLGGLTYSLSHQKPLKAEWKVAG